VELLVQCFQHVPPADQAQGDRRLAEPQAGPALVGVDLLDLVLAELADLPEQMADSR
jgi:hypothetical protein